MTTLLIDTAFDACQVGLAHDDTTLIAHNTQQAGGGQDRLLAGMVHELLRAHGKTVKDLSRIAVTTGPGRFTGLRVGIAFARGLALVHKTPLIGLATTDLFLADLAPLAEQCTVVLSVKRGESFIQHVNSPLIRVMDADLAAAFTAATLVGGCLAPETRERLNNHPFVRFADLPPYPSLTSMAVLAAKETLANIPVRPYYGA